MNQDLLIGIDIGGTNFRIGTVGRRNCVTNLHKCPICSVFSTENPLEDLKEYLLEYIARHDLQGLLQAVVIGFPATVNRERTRVLQAPNIVFMEGLDIPEVLEPALGIPVVIERDVCLTVRYDMMAHQIPAAGVLCGFYFGTGVGNVICLDGRPLPGKYGTAGELGHIPVIGSGQLCGCGNRGCIENLAGGKYLAKLCREVFPQCPIGNIFAQHGDHPLLRDFVDHMAVCVATEINILDPDYILIGGGVPNMPGFPKALLEDRIRAHTRKPYPEQGLDLVFCQDVESKSILGAAQYWRAKTGKDRL